MRKLGFASTIFFVLFLFLCELLGSGLCYSHVSRMWSVVRDVFICCLWVHELGLAGTIFVFVMIPCKLLGSWLCCSKLFGCGVEIVTYSCVVYRCVSSDSHAILYLQRMQDFATPATGVYSYV